MDAPTISDLMEDLRTVTITLVEQTEDQDSFAMDLAILDYKEAMIKLSNRLQELENKVNRLIVLH